MPQRQAGTSCQRCCSPVGQGAALQDLCFHCQLVQAIRAAAASLRRKSHHQQAAQDAHGVRGVRGGAAAIQHTTRGCCSAAVAEALGSVIARHPPTHLCHAKAAIALHAAAHHEAVAVCMCDAGHTTASSKAGEHAAGVCFGATSPHRTAGLVVHGPQSPPTGHTHRGSKMLSAIFSPGSSVLITNSGSVTCPAAASAAVAVSTAASAARAACSAGKACRGRRVWCGTHNTQQGG